MKLSSKNIFLIDGLGAILTALSHGFLLSIFHDYFGMPIDKLLPLAIAGAIFAIYSFVNYFLKSSNWQFYLIVIAISNLVFCCITGALLFTEKATLTYLGYAYFILEIIIVLVLSCKELQLASKRETL